MQNQQLDMLYTESMVIITCKKCIFPLPQINKLYMKKNAVLYEMSAFIKQLHFLLFTNDWAKYFLLLAGFVLSYANITWTCLFDGSAGMKLKVIDSKQDIKQQLLNIYSSLLWLMENHSHITTTTQMSMTVTLMSACLLRLFYFIFLPQRIALHLKPPYQIWQ